MNYMVNLFEKYGHFCADGSKANAFLKESIIPWMNDNPGGILLLNFANVQRMNSSFANALIGNSCYLFGFERIRVTDIKPDLKVIVVSALSYGLSLKEAEKQSKA